MDILAKNLLILAAAGSGKTFQLANRIIGLVARGTNPERIVALTFTRKAAGEFADSLLTKLADAAANQAAAAALRQSLALPDADFTATLELVVRSLPRLTLGTMDGFFAKVIRSFQYELGLTGGRFELLEGPRAAALTDDLLVDILGDALARDQGEEFFHAFRRATIGKEEHGVLNALRSFVRKWQGLYRQARDVEWGPAAMAGISPDDWLQQKSALFDIALGGLDEITYSRKGQREALATDLANLHDHVIGSGSLGSNISTLLASILEAAASPGTALLVKFHKEFTIDGPSALALRRSEAAAALRRTRAVRDVVAVYDGLCAQRLRSKGLLGFDDVKILMGDWSRTENARLRREAVDFRLDAHTDHWLLDEFQDTSRADWTGLLPLIDEAATNNNGTVFIVGDRKQAIYAWRGGDVGLFDELIERYSDGMEIAPLAESWRSCPEVLALVNRVCGDLSTMRGFFGDAADKWEWLDHFSATPLSQPAKRGEARVEVVGTWEERLDRLAAILHELTVGQRAMTCGILLRDNNTARDVADHLRTCGFDVIEEGRREPAKDNPVGIAMTHLLQWLADPADSFAREVVAMSPLAAVLLTNHGDSWPEIWANLTSEVAANGFVGMLGTVIADCWPGWSDFGRRRAGDLLAALATLDSQGGVSLREAAAWLARLEVAQSPGVAAVQVMTIHKAKGLGFDVVILPDVPDGSVPNAKYFEIAEGVGWLTQTPPQWARAIVPELRDAEARWAANQQYEAFCMLYVALTRAKRGLYVLLEPPAKSAAPNKPSLSNWIARAVDATGLTGVAYQTGISDWVTTLELLEPVPQPANSPTLGAAIPRRTRVHPSATNGNPHTPGGSAAGLQFGNDVHAILARLAWVDESPPVLPACAAGNAVASLLQNPALHEVFERRHRTIELWREQTADAIIDNQFLTGVIDRLHLHRNPTGTVTQVEIIDFKTDAVTDPSELIARHATQMNAYRTVMAKIYPNARVVCYLLSVRHGTLVQV